MPRYIKDLIFYEIKFRKNDTELDIRFIKLVMSYSGGPYFVISELENRTK